MYKRKNIKIINSNTVTARQKRARSKTNKTEREETLVIFQ